MLVQRGIEANQNKFQEVQEVPTNVKEVKQFTSRLAALSRFLSCVGYKTFLFFTPLKKKERDNQTRDFKEAFIKVNNLLTSPPILTLLREGSSLLLYLSVTSQATSSVLIQEIDRVETPMYFVRKVFRGSEACYQKINNLALVAIIAARKLRSCFQGRKILVKTNYHVQKVLNKANLAGVMVSCTEELSKYNIQYVPRGSIESQFLANFVEELNPLVHEKTPTKQALSVDVATNIKGNGVGIVLEGPGDIRIKETLKSEFT